MEKRSTSASSTTTANTSVESEDPAAPLDFSDHLPLQLIKSEAIPPAPTRSEATIDWLPDFAGYSWIAYGASSLLVISHFPNPLSEDETLIGPIFRQVFELSGKGSAAVSAVSWSPAMPSIGELAAALENCIGLFSRNSEAINGSFCWSQTAVLMQSTNVEAIKWTGSGDGIISGGSEVVLWRRKDRFWEIAWKFRPELPQYLVSATSSIDGLSATAPLSKQHDEGSSFPVNQAKKCVLVCQIDESSSFIKAELCHPLPVCMIQWRPSTGKQSKNDSRHPLRQVLLTCCLDGTIRLWSEIDDMKIKKNGKDTNDQKHTRLSFHVAAIVEINQALNGILGSNIFVRWATEIDGLLSTGKGDNRCFFSEGSPQDKVGRCEWLIGFGPQIQVTFWAIHCLDDVSPLRSPRVTLWKKQEIMSPEVGTSSLLLDKVFISRNRVFGPPIMCFLVQLLPNNSFAWSQLCTKKATSMTNELSNKYQMESSLSCCAVGVLNADNHNGKILQVAVHPYRCESELAASLNTDGLLHFWSLSTFPNCIMGMPILNTAWKFSGKLAIPDSYSKYSSLSWAPTVIDEDHVLLLGHARGIDCLIFYNSKGEDGTMLCHKICTIPFKSYGRGESPTNIFSIPLSCTCKETLVTNNFMVLAAWKEPFQALSWKIAIHSSDLSGRCCGCAFDISNTAEDNSWIFESNFVRKRYCFAVYPCSMMLPDLNNHDQVISFAVVCPTYVTQTEVQEGVPNEEIYGNYSVYHMITGHSDCSLKLWRSMPATSKLNSEWQLVGMLAAHQGPIKAISVTGCGRKIAIFCPAGQPNASSTLHIWECTNLIGAGSFILEDTLFFNGDIAAINWLAMGSGQLLLGVCLQNELQVYAQKRCGGLNLVKSGTHVESKIWICIAFAHTGHAICDFLWGPKAMAVVVYNEYFCLFSQLLFLADKKHQATCHLQTHENNTLDYDGVSDKNIPIFTDPARFDFKESSVAESDMKSLLRPLVKINMKNDILSSMTLVSLRQKCTSTANFFFWSVSEVVEKLGGPLPVYHAEALLMNIFSGNWKRAYVALLHVVDYVRSNNASAEMYRSPKLSYVIPPSHLPNYLEGLISTSPGDKAFEWREDATPITSSLPLQKGLAPFSSSWGSDASSGSFTSSTRSELGGFVEPLETLYKFAAITNTEKMQILAIIGLLQEVSDPHSSSAYASLDEPGRRFWVAVRFQQLYLVTKFGKLSTAGEVVVESGLIGWAFHSDCQENLFNSVLPNDPSWQVMRSMGIGYWYTNAAQLRAKMEKLARQQYLKNRDPKDCALLYIALNRLQVLAGLFKLSKDDKDKPLVGFLSRNFQEEKNKAAALKNAYVLLGRHQLELAIGFFLLGGDISSAVNICAKNLGDEQLALVICRLIEGYGGPLERHLILKLLLPSAIEKGDHWLASLLEWVLGNYTRAFLRMLGVQMDSLNNKSALSSSHVSFLDPSIGQYCLLLANKNCMKNAVGEHYAAVFSRWGILMNTMALNRCGLPLEALECLSSAHGIFGGFDQGNVPDIADAELLEKMLKPSPGTSSSNWISSDVASHMDTHIKFNLAMQYISNLLTQHPIWLDTNMASPGAHKFSEYDNHQDKILFEDFQHKLITVLACFDQKFSLNPIHLINMIVIFLGNNGLLFIGHHILQACISKDPSQDKGNAVGSFHHSLLKLFLKATEEFSYLFSRYIVSCNITHSRLDLCSSESSVPDENKFSWMAAYWVCMQGLILSLRRLRIELKLFCGSCHENFSRTPFTILDLCEFCIYFASAWLQRNYKTLVLIMKSLLVTCRDELAPYEINMEDLNNLCHQISELLAYNSWIDGVGDAVQTTKTIQYERHGGKYASIPEDERWQIIGASFWGHISGLVKHLLHLLPEKLEESHMFRPLCRLSSMFDSDSNEHDGNNMQKQVGWLSLFLIKLLRTTSEHISFYRAKQLASFILQKEESGLSYPCLLWIEEFSESRPRVQHNYSSLGIGSENMMDIEHYLSEPEMLWDMCATMRASPVLEISKWSQYIKQKHSNGWSDAHISIMGSRKAEETCVQDCRLDNGFAIAETSQNGHSLLSSSRKEAKQVMPFQIPKEIYKRNGELLEALCINSIDQQQAAVASNRKGIIFFNWEDGLPNRETSDYIWGIADWPHNGWAGSESTPIPTCVSTGVGLGSKEGSHLGLGGATVGVGSLARPWRDLTGGGAFGIPGYAGVGASGLGWGIQEDFEEFPDPPATMENINTRTLSSHPSRPFFLVGSSNTHVYLWEFGQSKATATYGVLPAANVPPPYALASISAVQFDYCGHRFATAALDGTVCTWQLEVGGRSNIRPTESSLCFNNHASDVKYVTASGSIVAAAGYSSSGVNVVIWDTLAPPTTSRASLVCHEGGARSLSVFDNDLGTGSISPLIVTGGKVGDVGLHDFRYVATGRTKRHRNFDSSEQNINASSHVDMQNKVGDRNANGMLWYIPKAHLGSVTKISTIPNTSLFLTGSKDGDVKLWDANRAKLVFHWPKLHERHTFLQPSSRGFGGVVRAAVTDIQVVSHGFLTCGGDGYVKLVQFKDHLERV